MFFINKRQNVEKGDFLHYCNKIFSVAALWITTEEAFSF